MNTFNFTGRLVYDPELKTTKSGLPVCTWRIAVKDPHKKDTTYYFDCVTWRTQAEFLTKYFRKGDMIAVTGHVSSRTYDKDGQKRSVIEFVTDTLDFCGGGGKSSAEQEKPAQAATDDFNELPF